VKAVPAVKNMFIFLGPPGSGKGSLSQLCVKRLGWTQLSTGNLCREHIAEQTEIGKQIDFAIKSGKLITDSLIICMVDEWLRKNLGKHTAVILDGFPRTIKQADSLRELLALPDFLTVKLSVIKMLVEDAEVVKRLSSRFICQNNKCQSVYSLSQNSLLKPKRYLLCDDCSSSLIRRTDDEEQAIRDRLLIYHKHEQDLINFYTGMGQLVISLDGEKSLEDVYDQFVTVIDSH
jgi:adenylate kinase